MDRAALPLTSEQMIQASRHQTDLYDGDYHFYQLQCGIHIHGGSLRARSNVTCRRMAKPYIAFVLLIEGTLRFGIGSDYHEISAQGQGQAVLINLSKEALFTRFLSQGEKLTKLTLNGLEQWLPKNTANLPSNAVQHWALSPTLKRLAKQWVSQPFTNDLAGNTHALQILNTCWETYRQELDRDESTCPTKIRIKELGLIDELERVYANGASNIDDIADALHISRRTLQRRVQDALGIPLQQWLLATKMQQAMEYLASGEMTIGEVAYHIGYRHPSNFIHAFKQHFGITPATVIQKHSQQHFSHLH
ncbi:helix-turn-helix transcriptional regulator [Cardiobacteriaceae bacterium TAE3-ERU3]|nr:helix-turn-helix transcriptional regulator [Cardiobacteriaceae bacterium TAE3-ERU3]